MNKFDWQTAKMFSLWPDARMGAAAALLFASAACGSDVAEEPSVAAEDGVVVEEAADQSAGEPDASDVDEVGVTDDGDFADGDAGGPDFWRVRNVAADDNLNIRREPNARAGIAGMVPNGTVLRNLGCRRTGNSRWCRVGSLADDGVDGWVNGRFLEESGPPAGRPTEALQPAGRPPADGTPQLVARATGEYELRYASGCTILLDGSAKILTAGSTCSAAQRDRAVTAVESYKREQGL